MMVSISTFYKELIKTKQVANEAKELAEKVGDTATYKWEIIDRTVTENTTTNE